MLGYDVGLMKLSICSCDIQRILCLNQIQSLHDSTVLVVDVAIGFSTELAWAC